MTATATQLDMSTSSPVDMSRCYFCEETATHRRSGLHAHDDGLHIVQIGMCDKHVAYYDHRAGGAWS